MRRPPLLLGTSLTLVAGAALAARLDETAPTRSNTGLDLFPEDYPEISETALRREALSWGPPGPAPSVRPVFWVDPEGSQGWRESPREGRRARRRRLARERRT